jgi:hypothetical protein
VAKADDSAEEIVSVYAVGSEVKQMGVVGIHPGLFFFFPGQAGNMPGWPGWHLLGRERKEVPSQDLAGPPHTALVYQEDVCFDFDV